MIADVEAGIVKRVIIKDMSRFGRDYLQVGMYTEIMFPEHDVHFIAVNDGVDSTKGDTHAHGALFHTDAVQAVGHVIIDVHKLGIDFLSASAHKFNGPKGVGFLYIRNGIELKPYEDGGVQENAHRAGTENIAAIIGMATALKANCDLLKQNQQHILTLEKQLLS